MSVFQLVTIVFFFNDTATTEIYSLSLHDALPISRVLARPGEAARLQPPGAQPHARAVVDQHLEPVGAAVRSGEHTSELQSPCYLACRLLLVKKKKLHHTDSLRLALTRSTSTQIAC